MSGSVKRENKEMSGSKEIIKKCQEVWKAYKEMWGV